MFLWRNKQNYPLIILICSTATKIVKSLLKWISWKQLKWIFQKLLQSMISKLVDEVN